VRNSTLEAQPHAVSTPGDGERASGGSYRSILKSTSMIGVASVLNIFLGMLRTKFIAVLLGPAGVGLQGIYVQITAVVTAVAGMGVSTSGVRQVAEAVASGDGDRVSRTATTLRRVGWLTGAVGLTALAAMSLPLSELTFGDTSHAAHLALLAVGVLLTVGSAAQSALLQGLRRISDVARVTVIGSMIATAIGVPCYYALGLAGVPVALVLGAAGTLLVSSLFARRLRVERIPFGWTETRREARVLLALGLSFMSASLLSTGTTYVVQAWVTRRFGVAGLGIYQAAFSLSGALVGFVLGAMGTDYYPRLTAVADDDASVRRMVNEQAQVSTLLALPGLTAMMVFAGVIIRLFFAAEFEAAVPVLRWCILGMLGRVLSWPLGFVLLAKGSGRLYFATEVLAAALNLGAVAFFTRVWGLGGAGIAFMVLYVVYTALMLLVVRRLVGGAWTPATLTLNATAAAVLVGIMLNASLNPEPVSRWGLGLLATAVTGWLSLRQLLRHAELDVRRLLPWKRAATS
jgi:PST family polysaccharide transporter